MSSTLAEPLRTLERLVGECSAETKRLDKMRETLWSIEYPKSMLDTGSGQNVVLNVVSSSTEEDAGLDHTVGRKSIAEYASPPVAHTDMKTSVGSTLSATRTENKANTSASAIFASQTEYKAKPGYISLPSAQIDNANKDEIRGADSSSFMGKIRPVHKPRLVTAVAESNAYLTKPEEGTTLVTADRDIGEDEPSQDLSEVTRPIPEMSRSVSVLGGQSTTLSAVLKRAVGGNDGGESSSEEEEAGPIGRKQLAGRSKSAGIAKLLGSLGGSATVVATEGDDDDEFDM